MTSLMDSADMGRSVFISYRRADSADSAGRIYDRLVERFGAERVFKDVDSIPPGVAFPEYITSAISQSAVELVIIGPRWLDASSGWNRRRLDDPADFVRIEIETALALGVPVIPVLVMGAGMPSARRLPDSLKPLAGRNALQARPDPDFRRDMDRVIASIEYWMAQPQLAAPSPATSAADGGAAPASAPTAPTPAARPAPAPASPAEPASLTPARAPVSAPVSTPVSAPVSTPVSAPVKPITPRRVQPGIAAIAVALVGALIALTFNYLNPGAQGSASLPAARQTQTAVASALLTQVPTLTYGPTAPGSCDKNALASDWTRLLENNHVTCANGQSRVHGPATLAFAGNGGFSVASTFSVTLSHFTATPTASVTLKVTLGDSRMTPAVFVRIFLNNQYRASNQAFNTDAPVDTSLHHFTALSAGAPLTVALRMTGGSWAVIIAGKTLKTSTYGSYNPSDIREVDLVVDQGADVTLSDFTVSST